MVEDWKSGGFGLYIHWPFCQSKCPYCDFNSHVAASIDQRRWAKAYVQEIERIGRETGDRILNTVFFGGGTPSLMAPETVAEVMDAVRRTWRTGNSFEVTLEANPTSVEAGRFAGYREAGVNRVSMGIQSLNDGDLRALGRLHTAAEAMKAFHTARAIFDRVSFDMIYARQDQTVDQWREELGRVLALAVDHVSLYQLTIEEGTAFGDRYKAGKLRGLPDEDRSATLWEVTQELCEAAGFPGYEVSNHARSGQESQHNLIYWRYGDYAGIGPGAHGRLTLAGRKLATLAPLQPGRWLDMVEGGQPGEVPREEVDTEGQVAEFLLMGLRLTEGVSLDRLGRLSGGKYDSNINYLCDIGVLEIADDRLRTTAAGRPVLNAVLQRLLAD